LAQRLATERLNKNFLGMSQLKRNILANYLGSGWSAIMSLIFIPFYLHFLGIEAYGLVGMFTCLQGMFGLLDLGLGATVNRELARLSIQSDKGEEMRQLVRTLEVIYWVVAVIIGVVILSLAPFLAHHWVQPKRLTPATVQQAFIVMGLTIACQWPLSFYSGGLMGLQRQVPLNFINIIAGTFRGAGVVLLLWLVSPTIQAFFIWQMIVGACQTLAVAWCLWGCLPSGGPSARFNRQVLREVWQFAAGMTGISITVIVLMQMDKIILSKLLTLEMFGYYTLAGVAAMSLYRLIHPIFTAIYPRLTQIVAQGDQAEMSELYHRSCQLMSVLILPAALVAALFSRELLLLWTRNPVTVEHTHILMSLLVIGTALSGLMNLPYALQLAYGWTRLALVTNIVSIIILVPLLFLFTSWYGAVGAALMWVALNCGYVFIAIQIMHRRLLKGEQWRWYQQDVGLPLAVTLFFTWVGRWLLPAHLSPPFMILYLAMVGTVSLVATALAAPQIRFILVARLNKGICF
jgi:O-antigen/teichoic acid export membrane protein